VTAIAPVISQLAGARFGLRRRLIAADEAEAIALVDCLIAESGSHGALRGMARGDASTTETNVVVVALTRDGSVRALAKIAATRSSAAARLQREASVLRSLAGDGRLEELRPLLPALLFEHESATGTCTVQSAIAGTPGDRLVHRRHHERLLPAAMEVAALLHQPCAARVSFGPPEAARWIRRPAEAVSDASTRYARNADFPRCLAEVARAAEAAMLGRSLLTGRVHGDFWLGNLLFTPDVSRVSGIVDWDQGDEHGLPILDVVHLLLYTRRLMSRRELGDVVRDVLREPRWSSEERRLIERSHADLLDDELARAATIVCWLGHVAANLAQSPAYARNRRWMRRNVLTVAAEAAASLDPS
jgi:aminoglycoside phosphotransferase (APT) family kinase protein